MAKVPLDGMTLNMLADGIFGRQQDAELRRIVDDLAHRGQDGKPRKLKIVVEFTLEGKGVVSVEPTVQAVLPPHRPPTTLAKYDAKAGGLIFNPDCADNPDQMTLGDVEQTP